MRKRTVLIGILAAVLAVIGWKGAWRYDEVHLADQPGRWSVRTHLVTGEVQVLSSSGWKPLPVSTRHPDCPPRFSDRSCAILFEGQDQENRR